MSNYGQRPHGSRGSSYEQSTVPTPSHRHTASVPLSPSSPADDMVASGPGHKSSPSSAGPLPNPTATAGPSGPHSSRGGPGSMHDLARVIQLFSTRKFYCEGYIKKASDLGGDGRPPTHGDPLAKWDDWFAQLTGSELSLWNVKAMNKAAAAGTTVPPTYLKINDSFVTFVDLNPRKAQGGGPPPDAPWVFALNNAGSNRILFACTDEVQHRRWINALRLAEWEVSRLSEIYTATLIGLRGQSWWNRSPLNKGIMDGLVDVRLPGETEWSKAYLVLSEAGATTKQKRRSSLMQSFSGFGSVSSRNLAQDASSGASYAAFFASKRAKKPFLIINHLLTIYAVWPESENLIHSSAIAKIEAAVEWDDTAEMPRGFELQARRRDVRDGGRAGGQTALLFTPDDIGRDGHARMLEWILGFCDTFKHFGRGRTAGVRSTNEFEFDPRKSASPYYAYPIGPAREQLFFAPATVEHLDIYERRPEQIRAAFQDMLVQRMRRAPSTGPQHPAGYLENGVPPNRERLSTSQAPQLSSIGEQKFARTDAVETIAPLASSTPASGQATQISPKPSLSIDTGSALRTAPQPIRDPYHEVSAFSSSIGPHSVPTSAVQAPSQAPSVSAVAAPIGVATTGAAPVGSDMAREASVPRSDRSKREVTDTPVSMSSMPGKTSHSGHSPSGIETTSSSMAFGESTISTAPTEAAPEGSYDSSTHHDMLAALDFIRSQPEPELTPRGLDVPSRRPGSATSSAPTHRTGELASASHAEIAIPDDQAFRSSAGIETPVVPGSAAIVPVSATMSATSSSQPVEERRSFQSARLDETIRPSPANVANGRRPEGQRHVGSPSSDEDEVAAAKSDAAARRSPLAPPLNSLVSSVLATSTSSSSADPDRRTSRRLPTPPSQRATPIPASQRATSPYLDQSSTQGQPRRSSFSSSRRGPSPVPDTYSITTGEPVTVHNRPLHPGEMSQSIRPFSDVSARSTEPHAGVYRGQSEPGTERPREGPAGVSAKPTESFTALPPPQPPASMQPAMYNMPPSIPGAPYGQTFPGYMPFMPMGDPAAMQAAMYAAQQAFMASMFAYSQQQGTAGPSAPSSPTAGYVPPLGFPAPPQMAAQSQSPESGGVHPVHASGPSGYPHQPPYGYSPYLQSSSQSATSSSHPYGASPPRGAGQAVPASNESKEPSTALYQPNLGAGRQAKDERR